MASPSNASPITKNRWRVRCEAPSKFEEYKECGNEITVPRFYLIRPNPKTHCGCQTETIKSRYWYEYRCWYMMRTRCNYEKHIAYKDYGGRGIKVCPEWDTLNGGFERWLAFIGPAPSQDYTQDRVDNDLGYQPFQRDEVTRQVRWATATEQRANQRPRKS